MIPFSDRNREIIVLKTITPILYIKQINFSIKNILKSEIICLKHQ